MKPSLKITTNLRQRLGSVLMLTATLVGAIAFLDHLQNAEAQTGDGRALILRSDRQEANRDTGVVTATGNVQINYPARQLQATSAQAQYFSRENRIVLTGNVYVLQQGGNSMRGETITYFIDEGRFVALPRAQQQVESTYIVSDSEAPTSPVAPATTPFNPKPVFKTPRSDQP
ncbi:MAG: organic solvent tolerance protein OstA [Symploca sp. SIO1B1]|nr:organic solvent tolerance protein OstA [Symploca sp. SIO2D2]NER22580.1 organic solvent tolerance protein OstA [Symploca sp. SIO1C2]NER46093.1 organic solvent tolerance protein OstA [Symploca sp. SIO1A3]NER93098.1 organic solvent tolerance protein OstA [Symploca sp. SIO1B1]